MIITTIQRRLMICEDTIVITFCHAPISKLATMHTILIRKTLKP